MAVRHDTKFTPSAPCDEKPDVGGFDMLIGVAVSFIALLIVSVVNPIFAAYLAVAIVAVVVARLLFRWLSN